jgi:hypothetical protein
LKPQFHKNALSLIFSDGTGTPSLRIKPLPLANGVLAGQNSEPIDFQSCEHYVHPHTAAA